MEPTVSASAVIEQDKFKQELVFGPECLVFGPKDPKGTKP